MAEVKRGRPAKKVEAKPEGELKGWKKWKARMAEAEKRWGDSGGAFVSGAEDILHIDPDRIPPDMDLRWVRVSTYGQPDPKNYAAAERNAYVKLDPADRKEIDGCEIVEEGGLVLMVRSRAISERARSQQYQDAVKPLETQARRAGEGDLGDYGVTLDPRKAKSSNVFKKSIERIDIPKD
jgi:hypothetical protein